MSDLPKKPSTPKPRSADDQTPTVPSTGGQRQNHVSSTSKRSDCDQVPTTCAAEYNKGLWNQKRKLGCPTLKSKRGQDVQRRHPVGRYAYKACAPPAEVCDSRGIVQPQEKCPVHPDYLRECCIRCYPWLPYKLRQLLTQLSAEPGRSDALGGAENPTRRAKQRQLLRTVIEMMEAEILQHTSGNSTQHGHEVSTGPDAQSQTGNTSEESGVLPTEGNLQEPAATGSTPVDKDKSSGDQSEEEWEGIH